VDKTVFVECRQFYRSEGPAELRPVGETEFVEAIAGPVNTRTGVTDVAAGIVGFADLTLGLEVQPVLEAHLEASGRFRGVRHASAMPAPGMPATGCTTRTRTHRSIFFRVRNSGRDWPAWNAGG